MSQPPMKAVANHTVGLAAAGVSLFLVLVARNFSSGTILIWELLSHSDLGNALAALVAVGGYLIDAYNNRQSQQLEAQIARVSAQSHDFLVPVTTQFHSLFLGSTMMFVDKHFEEVSVAQSGSSYNEKDSKEMLEQILSNPMMTRPTALQNPHSMGLLLGEVMFNERTDLNSRPAARTTAPRELPLFLHNAILAASSKKKKSSLWKSYEIYIRYEFVPGVDRIGDLIDQHGHLMEPVPESKLTDIYQRDGPGVGTKWKTMPRMWFYSIWLSYARAWKSVLAMWDDGDYSQIRPSMFFPVGILFFNVEAQTIVAAVENELVGMSQMHGHESTEKKKKRNSFLPVLDYNIFKTQE